MTNNLQKQGSKMTLRRSFWFIFTLCQLAFVGVQAQDRSITGVVIGSDDNAGIPGVSIKVMEPIREQTQVRMDSLQSLHQPTQFWNFP